MDITYWLEHDNLVDIANCIIQMVDAVIQVKHCDNLFYGFLACCLGDIGTIRTGCSPL